ncbi:MFS transporter [Nocardia niigatensis]
MENVILAVVATGYSRGSGGAVGILGTGLLLMRWSWLSIPFTATVAGVVLAIAGCAIPADESRPRFDVWGALFAATAVGLIVVAATEIPERGWFDPVSAGSTGLGAIALIAFVLVELVVPQPLLDVRVFADRGLAGGAAAVTVQYLIMFGMFPVVVQFLQLILGYRPLPSAFGVAPIMAPLVVVSPIAPWLAERTGLRAMLCAGSVVTALGMYGLSRLTVDSGYVDVLWPLLVLGLGLALSATPATAAIVSGLPAEKHGVAAAVNDATREVGGAIGIAVGGSVRAAGYSHHISALLPALPPPLRGPVSDSLAAALRVADSLGPAAHPLAEAARTAFIHGARESSLTLSGMALLAALAAAVRAPGRPGRHSRSRSGPSSLGQPSS